MEIPSQRSRKTHLHLSLCLIALCAAFFSAAGCHADGAGKNAATGSNDEPLAVEWNANGYLYRRSLKVDPGGKAEATEGNHDANPRTFQVSADQLKALRKVLETERFFDLGGVYGEPVPDGGEVRLKVIRGRKAQTVTLLFLGNWERVGHPKLAEAHRAVRVLDLVEGWRRESGPSD